MSLKKTILLLIIGVAWIATGLAQKAANTPLQNKVKSANIMYVNHEYAELEHVYADLMLKGALNDQEKSQYADVLLRGNKYNSALLVLAELNNTTLLSQGVELDCYLYLKDFEKLNSLSFVYADMLKTSIDRNLTIEETYYSLPKRENFHVNLESFNSSMSDFAPTLLGESLYFASTRFPNASKKEKSKTKSSQYQNMYKVEGRRAVLLDKKVNSNFHDGPICFNDSANVMLVGRNNYKRSNLGNNKEDFNELQIFKSVKQDNGKWGKFEALSFCSKYFSCSHPSIKEDRLYFSSDMPGGYGQTDLYYVNVDQDVNVIGKVTNLGPEINGARRECFPFVDENDILYFSSNSHVGLGGLDIFKAKIYDKKYLVRNVGNKINTQWDDFALVIKNMGEAYLSSNRTGGKGNDDIYSVKIDPVIKGKILNEETNEPVSNISFSISKLPADSLINAVSDLIGCYKIDVKLASYTAQITVDGTYDYMPYDSLLEEDIDEDFVVLLEPRKIGVMGLAYDKMSKEVFSNVKIRILKEGELFDEILTNAGGVYRKRLDREFDYSLLAIREGFFPIEVNISTKNTMEWIGQDFAFVNGVELEDIHYAFDSYEITDRAAEVLNNVVEMLEKYPWMMIELSSHTDSRGSVKYNNLLASKRSEAVKSYLVNKGVSKERLVCSSFGELRPLNKCIDGVMCSPKEYQLNRRTEIIIVE